MNKALHDYDYSTMDYLAADMVFQQADAASTDRKILEGKQFCITGKVTQWKNRDELKSYIESLGGKVTGSVTSKTDYLINNDSASSTQKNLQAQKLNKPIITEKDFSALIRDLLAL